MITKSDDSNPIDPLRRVPALGAAVVIFIALLGSIGRGLDVSSLKSLFAAVPPMMPSIGLGLILSSGSLLLLRKTKTVGTRRVAGYTFASVVVLLGLSVLGAKTIGADRSLDQLLLDWTLTGPWVDSAELAGGIEETGDSIGLLLSGLALLLLRVETLSGWRPAQVLAVTVGLIGVVALLGYGNAFVSSSEAGWHQATTPYSAISFIILPAAILGVHPQSGLLAVVASKSTSGLLIRRLLPAVLIMPLAFGWLAVVGVQAGLWDNTFALIGSSAVTTVVLAILMYRSARLLRESEQEQKRVIERLTESSGALELQVDRRTAQLAEAQNSLENEIEGRQRTLADLHRIRQEHSILFDNSIVGLHWVAMDGTILRANVAELDLLGYSSDEYIGHHISEFHIDQSVAEDLLQRLSCGEKLENYETRLRAKDGSVKYVQLSTDVLRKNNRFDQTLCFTRDVTDRKRFEYELTQLLAREQAVRAMAEETEVRYHNLVHGLDAVVWEADAASLEFTFVSRRAESILGYPVERWTREPGFWMSLIVDEDRTRVLELLRVAAAEARDDEYEYRVTAADGRVVWLHDTVYVVRNGEDRTQRLRGLMMDITDRKRAEDERAQLLIREQAARAEAEQAADKLRRLQGIADISLSHLGLKDLLSQMLDHIRELLKADGAALLLLDEEGKVLTARSSVGPMQETDDQTPVPIGKGIVGRIASERAPIILHNLASLKSKTGDNLHSECRSLIGAPLLIEGRVIGVIRAIAVEASRFTDDDLRLLQLAADRVALVIEHARLYEAEQSARVEAERANRMKDEFLAIISHELRSPLNAILGWVVLMREGKLDADATRRALETVERSARSQNRMINDLFDVSRIISGKLRLNLRPIPPAQIVESAVEALRPAAAIKEIELHTDLDSETGPLLADSDRLQQIVWNLVSNAIRFTPKGGQVRICLHPIESLIEIVVTDTGAGINQEFLPHVFDRFRQADSSSRRKQGGLGLGLAIVRHLAELHGGTVEAASAGEGQGATFSVRLPLMGRVGHALKVRQPFPVMRASETVARQLQIAGIRVLVVDDEPAACELVNSILTGEQAEVRTATSMSQALRILDDWAPDLVISDIEMPGADGYSLIRQIRTMPDERIGRVPALALTAYSRVEDRMRALAAGFHMHVAKPVEPAELVIAVASLTGRIKKTADNDIFGEALD